LSPYKTKDSPLFGVSMFSPDSIYCIYRQKITSLLLAALLIPFLSSFSPSTLLALDYNTFFTPKTMRVDYYHTGTSQEEIFSIDNIYEEGNWPGSKHTLLDTLNLGKYLVKVFDARTNQLIYSRGYCTIFGEWQSTNEAMNGVYRTMHETVRFPYPRHTIQLTISVRDKHNTFREKFSTIIDPQSRFINHDKKKSPFKLKAFMKNGDPAEKIDLLILGDGYTKDDLKKYHEDIKRYIGDLFNAEPFKKHKNDFNVWMLDVISQDSGIDEPREGKWRDTVLGASYNSLDSPRYVLTLENRVLRDIAGTAPYDYLYILVNSPRYGGGGIFNWFATCYTGAQGDDPVWWSDYVFVHEFGHAFAGLGDEYYTSNVSYNDFYSPDTEPWEPNITALLDKKHPKWGHLIEKDTPIPTPWEKATYDSLASELRKLDRSAPDYQTKASAIREKMRKILMQSPYAHKVGCFEGAGYASQGLYRPYIDCRMFSKSLVDFCPVCQEAIEKMINFLTD